MKQLQFLRLQHHREHDYTVGVTALAAEAGNEAILDWVGDCAEQRDDLAPSHCPVPPVLGTKGIAHIGPAALRDFDPTYDRLGSRNEPAHAGARCARRLERVAPDAVIG